jgi:hypothetical protein
MRIHIPKLARLFRKPTAAALAVEELEAVKRELLRHQAASDYHARMSEYCIASIRRLGVFIKEEQQR